VFEEPIVHWINIEWTLSCQLIRC